MLSDHQLQPTLASTSSIRTTTSSRQQSSTSTSNPVFNFCATNPLSPAYPGSMMATIQSLNNLKLLPALSSVPGINPYSVSTPRNMADLSSLPMNAFNPRQSPTIPNDPVRSTTGDVELQRKEELLDTASISTSFLRLYYNSIHLGAKSLRKYYFVGAKITRPNPDVVLKGVTTKKELDVLSDVQSVNIEHILHQKSLFNSILIKANGIMDFGVDRKEFAQTFLIHKSLGFWLIHNDILEFPKSLPPKMVIVASQYDAEEIEYDHRRRRRSRKMSSADTAYPPSAVNKGMVNRFYHDASYQNYNNELAVFIRSIPNNITHSKLCGIIHRALMAFCEDVHMEIIIDYVDVNYHKQFAFVYFGNQETLELALDMRQIAINGTYCEIQKKHSSNGPRKHFARRRVSREDPHVQYRYRD